MKIIKYLLAAVAVSCAFTATAFATPLNNDHSYTFSLVPSSETVNAGDELSVSVYISAKDADGVEVDELTEVTGTNAMALSIGLNYNSKILTWIDNDVDGVYTDTEYDPIDLYYTVVPSDDYLGLVLTEQYRKIKGITPDTVVLTYKFKVADDAESGTYTDLVSLKADTTSYANNTLVQSTLKKVMDNPTITIAGKTPVGPTKATKYAKLVAGDGSYVVIDLTNGETIKDTAKLFLPSGVKGGTADVGIKFSYTAGVAADGKVAPAVGDTFKLYHMKDTNADDKSNVIATFIVE